MSPLLDETADLADALTRHADQWWQDTRPGQTAPPTDRLLAWLEHLEEQT